MLDQLRESGYSSRRCLLVFLRGHGWKVYLFGDTQFMNEKKHRDQIRVLATHKHNLSTPVHIAWEDMEMKSFLSSPEHGIDHGTFFVRGDAEDTKIVRKDLQELTQST